MAAGWLRLTEVAECRRPRGARLALGRHDADFQGLQRKPNGSRAKPAVVPAQRAAWRVPGPLFGGLIVFPAAAAQTGSSREDRFTLVYAAAETPAPHHRRRYVAGPAFRGFFSPSCTPAPFSFNFRKLFSASIGLENHCAERAVRRPGRRHCYVKPRAWTSPCCCCQATRRPSRRPSAPRGAVWALFRPPR